MTNKVCFKCNTEKPLSEFYKHAQMADGHVNKCKECNKKDVRVNYRENIDHYKEYEKERCKTPERRERNLLASRELRLNEPDRKKYYQSTYYKNNKEKIDIWQQEYTKNNPEKTRARSKVSNAIRDGRLHRMPCIVCGEEKSQAHHEDYSKPLEVMWLCPKHHHEHEHKN